MNASSILRKLKDLDALEERVKALKDPSQKMLKSIAYERELLLKGDPQEELKK